MIAQEEGGDRARDRSAERRRVARAVDEVYVYAEQIIRV